MHLNFNYLHRHHRWTGHPVPEPELNIEVAPPVVAASDDGENGEDVARPTIEAHVELVKTVGK